MMKRLLPWLLLLWMTAAGAAVGVTHLDTTADTGNTPNTGTAFTPASGSLQFVCVNGAATVESPGTITNSAGLTYTLVTSLDVSSGTATLYMFVANTTSTASSQTVTFDPVDQSTGTVISVFEITGITRTGTSAVKQSKTRGAAVGTDATPDVTFDASALTGNPTIGCLVNTTNPAAVTEPTNWTEASDTGHASPTIGYEDVFRVSGFTGTNIAWGTSASNWGAIIVEVDASTVAPVFTSAPAIGTPTTSAIPINFTSDTTGTVYGARLTDGSGTPTCDQLEAQTATGGVQYWSEAVVATVADNHSFSSITDGTVTDGYFCIEDGSNNDSAVASIADMYKLPAFSVSPSVSAQGDNDYTITKTLDGAGTVYCVVVPKDATAPSVTNVEALQASGGGLALATASDDATGTVTIGGSLVFPINDLYCVGTYGSQHEAAVHTILDELLDVPSGKQRVILTSVDSTSPYSGQGPATGDYVTIDLVTTASSYNVTQDVDGTVSYAAGGDPARQFINASVYDVSAAANLYFLLVYNNLPPTNEPPPFADPLLYERNVASSSLDLAALALDPEGDAVVVTALDTLPTGLAITLNILSGTPTVCDDTNIVTLQYLDQYGGTTLYDANFVIGAKVPNVINGSEAAAITAIEALCSLNATAGNTVHSDIYLAGKVVYTEPAVATVVAPDQEVLYHLSNGPARGTRHTRSRLGLGF